MRITAISQTISNGINKEETVLITSKQLKEANFIFAEHNKLLEENKLLYTQLNNYKNDNKSLISIDSLRVKQIENYELLSKSYENKINSINKQLDKKSKDLLFWKISGVSISAGLLLFCLFK